MHGYLHTSDNLGQIKGSMLTIIMTRPGERVMRPRFGTPLHRLKGRPHSIIASEARQMIALSLKKWETRVQVTEVNTMLLDDGDLNIDIFFIDPHTNLQDIHRLTLQVGI